MQLTNLAESLIRYTYQELTATELERDGLPVWSSGVGSALRQPISGERLVRDVVRIYPGKRVIYEG
jgi:hypothetical protein